MYSIVIKKITREFVEDREYVGKDDERANEGNYYVHEVEQDVERQVYTQMVDDLDIKQVIDAVNVVNTTQTLPAIKQ